MTYDNTTTNTAPAFMLTTDVGIVDPHTFHVWIPKRVVIEDAEVLAYYSDGPAAECIRYGYSEAVHVIPKWSAELLNSK
jgi:hypothetical protein